ncbi:MAG TPA: hypothetical protein PLS49_03785 [Candidatus Woesebacteria bacterium]|nr:hypothetical protein [Candidatus Woesebacteria bacterium]
MIHNLTQKPQEQDVIVMGIFGYVPYLKKDSREKIIRALDDVIETENKINTL